MTSPQQTPHPKPSREPIWRKKLNLCNTYSEFNDCWSRCCLCNDLDKPEKKMTDKYYPRGEIKKLKVEMWNLKVKCADVVRYNKRFQELALMCARMFPEESDKIERYVSGLPDMIHGSVIASKPKTMQDAIEFTTELMDKKINTFAERQAENKRKCGKLEGG
ncbi:reverse transcriptase domain-containing protein [Tanacetum coccineum]